MPKVSVIIPCYNSAGLIVDAIDSVISQTFKNFDIIVVDDGGSDNIADVLKRYDVTIHLLRQDNAGPAAARNRGMKEARGEYIAFLDADDIWFESKLEKQVKVLDAEKAVGFVYTNGYRWRPPEAPEHGRPTPLSKYYPEHPRIDVLFKNHMIPTSSVLFRRSLVSEAGYMNEGLRGGEDYEFFLRLINCSSAYHIIEPLMGYRIHSANTSSLITGHNVRERIWRKLNARHEVLKSTPELLRYRRIKLFSSCPEPIQYLFLLYWRAKYGGSTSRLIKDLVKYSRKLFSMRHSPDKGNEMKNQRYRYHRGRDIFKIFKPAFSLLIGFFKLLPIRLCKWFLVRTRYLRGHIGMGIRYVLVKRLAKQCGDNISIHDSVFFIYPERASLGDNISIHPLCYIDAQGDIKIGSDVSIAHGVSIISFEHDYRYSDRPIKDAPCIHKKVVIEDNVWIGAGAKILGGVTIGSGAVIGAGAVVTKNVGEMEIVAGVPARVLKKRTSQPFVD